MQHCRMDWTLLSSLPDADRRQVLASTRRRSFRRGEVLVHEGDPSDTLHLVASGRLAVQVSTSRGDNATVNVLGRGDYFGEVSLLDGHVPRRTASVLALEPVETLSLSASAFRALRARHPGVQELVLTLLARRVEELSDRLVEALYSGLDQRIHRRLVELAAVYSDVETAFPVTIPLTQDQLAELVGAARPSVNQVLQGLVTQGIVALGRGRIVVLDLATLRRKAA